MVGGKCFQADPSECEDTDERAWTKQHEQSKERLESTSLRFFGGLLTANARVQSREKNVSPEQVQVYNLYSLRHFTLRATTGTSHSTLEVSPSNPWLPLALLSAHLHLIFPSASFHQRLRYHGNVAAQFSCPCSHGHVGPYRGTSSKKENSVCLPCVKRTRGGAGQGRGEVVGMGA